jgi:hypothetical protein
VTWEGQGNILQGLVQRLREDVARLEEEVVVGTTVAGSG